MEIYEQEQNVMKFGEKVRTARVVRGLTLDELASKAHVSNQSLIKYERQGLLPRSRVTYYRIAEALEIDPEALFDPDAEFVLTANERFGDRAAKQALQLIQQIISLYANGELDEEDMDAMHSALTDAFIMAKERNKRHTNKRYLVATEQGQGGSGDELGGNTATPPTAGFDNEGSDAE